MPVRNTAAELQYSSFRRANELGAIIIIIILSGQFSRVCSYDTLAVTLIQCPGNRRIYTRVQ